MFNITRQVIMDGTVLRKISTDMQHLDDAHALYHQEIEAAHSTCNIADHVVTISHNGVILDEVIL